MIDGGFLRSGLGQMCLSALCFSWMGLFMKELRVEMSAEEVVFFRSLICLILTLSYGRWSWNKFVGRRPGLLLLRGFAGFVALQLYVYALGVVPYAEAAALLYTSPMFTALFAALFLRESMPRIAWWALSVSLAGSFLILRPEFDGALVGGLCALGAGVLSGVAYTAVRALARTEDNLTIVLYFPLVSLPFAGFMMLDDFVWPDGVTGWALVLGVGVSAQLGQVFLTRGLRAGRAGIVTSGTFLTLTLAALWSYLFYGEVLAPRTLAGAALIVGAIVLLASRRVRGG